ncbi:hypothetical protein [Facilibium subflavum]|uniref:hypothetical protein n=1 Tax=Facilibium subflavum TaxID=2219058 RepID=UPI000E64FE33|nr:hypothetical protein [Facilibium subflavum]
MKKLLSASMSALFISTVAFADMPNTLLKPMAYRFFLSQTSTKTSPTTFHCTVKLVSQKKPPCSPDGAKCQAVQVIMMNHGQNIQGFRGNNSDNLSSLGHGRLALTATELNKYYFESYHDADPGYAEQSGYVDIMVAWPNAKVYCAPGKGYVEPLELNIPDKKQPRLVVPGDFG